MSNIIDINSQVLAYNLGMENVPYLREATALVIKKARTNAGLSQIELADFAGLSRSYIAAIETGKTGFSGDALFLIAGILKVAPGKLITEIDALRTQKPTLAEIGRGRPKKQ